jgi:nucleotide-binding universal stress UspA family protein
MLLLLCEAEKRNCDLIVMGTQRHGMFENALLGSKAQRVVRQSKNPVLVVHLPEEGSRTVSKKKG